MHFWGRYGDLPTVEAARMSLQDIADNIKPEDLKDDYNPNATPEKRYDSIRLLRMIEGLQMVIWLNGGVPPVTWLPQLFDPKSYKKTGAK